MTENQTSWDWLTDHVPIGRSNAISANSLSALINRGERDLRQIIETARHAGVLICGDARGYYFAGSAEELIDYVRVVRCRIKTSSQCLAPFIRELKKPGGFFG